ncbi:hypothetical protein KEH51_23990 [[Brevibacterium] frigoritolerans]|uniref:Uncharacterized protein n=1 Tax=Peribacillus frigoritolerans TaxID=450367 RepID=A0A941FKT3_9BACI|nr:hypothetical protein [Peribacillus frigoritolerans]
MSVFEQTKSVGHYHRISFYRPVFILSWMGDFGPLWKGTSDKEVIEETAIKKMIFPMILR